jgi:hypothetical protein
LKPRAAREIFTDVHINKL